MLNVEVDVQDWVGKEVVDVLDVDRWWCEVASSLMWNSENILMTLCLKRLSRGPSCCKVMLEMAVMMDVVMWG